MSINNKAVWIPVASLLLAIGGAYLSSQVSIAQQLGDKVSRQELKEAVNDSRDTMRRELDDVKKRQDQTTQEIQETNRLLRQWMIKNQGGSHVR